MEYLTLADIKFRPHFLTESLGVYGGLKYGNIFFQNGFGLVVVKGDPDFTRGYKYEYSIVKGTEGSFRLLEKMPKFTNSKEEITKALNAVQYLDKE